MRALTIRQPWIGAILAGRKRIENRSWRSTSTLGRRILLHAGSRLDRAALDGCLARGWRPDARVDTLGAIVGSALVVDFVERSDDPWFMGPIGWVLDDVRACSPVPCLGRLGLWTPSNDVLRYLGEPSGVADAAS